MGVVLVRLIGIQQQRADAVAPRRMCDFTVPSGSAVTATDLAVAHALAVGKHHAQPFLARQLSERAIQVQLLGGGAPLRSAPESSVLSRATAGGAAVRRCASQALIARRRSQAPKAATDLRVGSERHARSNTCCARSSASAGSRHSRRSRLRSHDWRRRTSSVNAPRSPLIASATTAASAAWPNSAPDAARSRANGPVLAGAARRGVPPRLPRSRVPRRHTRPRFRRPAPGRRRPAPPGRGRYDRIATPTPAAMVMMPPTFRWSGFSASSSRGSGAIRRSTTAGSSGWPRSMAARSGSSAI